LKYSTVTFVQNNDILRFIDAQHPVAHNKVMVIDGPTVITGSFNFTKTAEHNNAENLLVVQDDQMAASYSPGGELVFNRFRLGTEWFEQGITRDVVCALICEFGHEHSPDHQSAQYHEALCRIGAKEFLLARQGQLA
jgi:hypothetical protein